MDPVEGEIVLRFKNVNGVVMKYLFNTCNGRFIIKRTG